MCLLLFLSPYILATQRSHRCHVISYALVMIIKSSNITTETKTKGPHIFPIEAYVLLIGLTSSL